MRSTRVDLLSTRSVPTTCGLRGRGPSGTRSPVATVGGAGSERGHSVTGDPARCLLASDVGCQGPEWASESTVASGKKTDAETVRKIAEVYGRTGNASEAARVAGVPIKTAAKIIAREKRAKPAEIRARAFAEGVETGTKALRAIIASGVRRLESVDDSSFGSLASSLARAAEALPRVESAPEDRKLARLAREKMRAETELLRRRVEGSLPPEQHAVSLTAMTDDELREYIARLGAGAVGDGEP